MIDTVFMICSLLLVYENLGDSLEEQLARRYMH